MLGRMAKEQRHVGGSERREPDRETARETARVRGLYDRAADSYDRFIGPMERLLLGDGRRWACERARGRTLEIAIGTGRNLPFYPAGTDLTGVDISAEMLAFARVRGKEHDRPVALHTGDAQALPFADRTFDTVVCTLALCSIPDEKRALTEVARVLRPGGRFVAVEHVASRNRLLRLGQRALDPVCVRLQGDHLLREPSVVAAAVGLRPVLVQRSRLYVVERLVTEKPV